jgi:hypothetical protein
MADVRLLRLPEDTAGEPGHGEDTTTGAGRTGPARPVTDA